MITVIVFEPRNQSQTAVPKKEAGSYIPLMKEGFRDGLKECGYFHIPIVFGDQIETHTPENALYGFAVFYFFCLLLNWWYYPGPNAEYKNP